MTEHRPELDGLAAIVTGGASGIGAEVVRLLAQRGARVAVLDLQAPHADSAAETSVCCDVTDSASVDSAVERSAESFGRLDIVVNNAGIGASGSVADADDVEWARLFDVNVTGMARVSRAALPHLRRSSAAAIVNTSSVLATTGVPNRALYSATKGAVLSLTLAMAADHLAENIRVNCVLPGTTETPWVSRLLEDTADAVSARRALVARQPIGRLVDPGEVASAIAYLASPGSGSTTGSCLAVDGGMGSLRIPS